VEGDLISFARFKTFRFLFSSQRKVSSSSRDITDNIIDRDQSTSYNLISRFHFLRDIVGETANDMARKIIDIILPSFPFGEFRIGDRG
jgi:hypothetical protein